MADTHTHEGSKEGITEWISKNSIVVHPKVAFGASALGGLGVFIDHDGSIEADVELLRIPRKCGFDYERLLDILDEVKRSEEDMQPGIKESTAIVQILELAEPSTETEIVTCYMWGFELCRRNREAGRIKKSVLSSYDWYMDILINTDTLPFPPDNLDSNDQFLRKLKERAKKVKEIYDLLCSSFSEEYKFAEMVPFSDFYQLHQAVKSRVLEIPQIDEGSDDFYVNHTLVPLLDFANHTHEPTAYFDVDKESNCILLKSSGQIDKGHHEVTICYSPTESIQEFVSTYGFIPQSHDDFQLFELPLDFASFPNPTIPHIDLVCKWLRINPRVQFVFNSTTTYLNFFNSNLPLLFIEGLSYNENWRDNAFKSFKSYNMIDIDHSNENTIMGFLEYQEKNCDIVNGVEPIGVLVNGNEVTMEELQDATESDEKNSFESLIERASIFVAEYSHYCLDVIERSLLSANSNDKKFYGVLHQYHTLEAALLKTIDQKISDPTSLPLPLELAKDEWETQYRSAPSQIPVEALLNQFEQDDD